MSATTIRIEDGLKIRVAALAQRAGKTSHAFIVEALEQKVEQLEVDEEFHRLADERWTRILATGKTVPWEDARSYEEAPAIGQHPRKPAGRKRKQQAVRAGSSSLLKSFRIRSLSRPHAPIRGRKPG